MKTTYRYFGVAIGQRNMLACVLLLISFVAACTSQQTYDNTKTDDSFNDSVALSAPVDASRAQTDSPNASSKEAALNINVEEKPVVTEKVTVAIVAEKNSTTIPTPKKSAKAQVQEKSKAETKLNKKSTVSPAVKMPLSKPVAVPRSSFNGQVRLLGKQGEILSPAGIIILLEPKSTKGHTANSSPTPMIDMLDKKYTPSISTVSTQQVVKFRNRDAVKHNVFSSSGDNSFDLGTYSQGKVGKTQFKKTGVVKVYCNIHPDMVTFIGVSAYNYASVTDDKGRFSVKGLLEGSYTVTIWSPRGEMSQSLYISKNAEKSKNFTLNTASYKNIPHKNKHGKTYETFSLFDDEFY